MLLQSGDEIADVVRRVGVVVCHPQEVLARRLPQEQVEILDPRQPRAPFEESEKFNRVLIDEILPVSDSTLITFSRLIGANLKPIFSLSFCAWLIEDGALAPAACRFDPNNQPLLP